jgi:hypothetical protein
MEEKPDHALVAAVAPGDAAALRTLYLRYERPTFNLISTRSSAHSASTR